ncbi:peptidase inhibitor family I36 protein [Streptomyces europaeiscabiei]|uniref:peptidase inhibitor family I36 protein n=1 Tax=Streptomyces europaeiscabiei TaxID=146819 RepID=UPI0006283989|nr:peptidase inhibitor family I36 protein [Streptomyces europaeiscabiei]MDX2773461.1 peptidase inhibitor family I36 protein [Streptomyces europaeiscabiei]MDX3715578.1 peptidase inhibitor family I36 protein [Streptomyces europaeiscabiei]
MAHASLSECNANNMCMWGNNDFHWLIGERAHGSTTRTNMTGDRNDEMDSWANRSATHTGCMAEHRNGSACSARSTPPARSTGCPAQSGAT